MRSGLCLYLLLALGCAGDAGRPGPATLGAGLRPADGAGSMVLQDLAEDGPAASAGLRAGDRLLSLDGSAVDSSCALERLLLARSPGQEVKLTVRRGPEILEKPVKLAGALALYEKACNAGPASGCYELGILYVKGQGVTADPPHANQLFEQACHGGSAAACAELGGRYIQKLGGAASDARILDLVRQACDGHNAAGCAHLAFLYATGRGVPRDDGRALSLYQDACDGGDAPGCYNVGLHFEKARGTLLENTSRALISYRRSCDLGYALGCTNLAFLYEKGLGVPRDMT